MAAYTPNKPDRIDDYESKRTSFYNAFKAIAGDDNEIDVWELQGLLNKVLRKELRMTGEFSLDGCRSMIAMNDDDRSGKLGFEEFEDLWKNINAWTKIFRRFDTDGSGTFSGQELHLALSAVGYRLHPEIYKTMVLRYANKDQEITLDNFLACATKLRHTFEIFVKYREENNKAKLTRDQFVINTIYS